jgi:hypothetical protein
MSTASTQPPSYLTILVPDQGQGSVSGTQIESRPEEDREEALFSLIPHVPVSVSQVPLDKVKAEMGEVEQQIDQLLSGLKSTAAGYQLAQIHVSVGISGQGSIGIVTAGMQASITLVYSAPENRNV